MLKQLLNTLYVQAQGAYVRLDHETLKLEVERELKLQVPLTSQISFVGTAGDTVGAARCVRARGLVAWGACRTAVARAAYERAYALFRDAGVASLQRDAMDVVIIAAAFAGAHVDEVRRLLDGLREDAAAGGPLLAAGVEAAAARVQYGAGEIDRRQLERAIEEHVLLLRETGAEVGILWTRNYLSVAAWLEGDAEGELRAVREAVVEHERAGAGASMFLANAIARVATVLCRHGDADAALEELARARAIAHADDVADQIELDAAEAHARALRGEAEEARRLLERAHRRAAGIDMAFTVNALLYAESAVLAALGDVEVARTLLARLAADAEARGAHRFAGRYRRDLAELA